MKETTPLNINDLSKEEGNRLIATITEAMAKHDQPASRAEFESHQRATKDDLRNLHVAINEIAEDHRYTVNRVGKVEANIERIDNNITHLADGLGYERSQDAYGENTTDRLKRIDEIEARLAKLEAAQTNPGFILTDATREFLRRNNLPVPPRTAQEWTDYVRSNPDKI